MDRRNGYLAGALLILVGALFALGGLHTCTRIVANQRAIEIARADAERRLGPDCCRTTRGHVLCRLDGAR